MLLELRHICVKITLTSITIIKPGIHNSMDTINELEVINIRENAIITIIYRQYIALLHNLMTST